MFQKKKKNIDSNKTFFYSRFCEKNIYFHVFLRSEMNFYNLIAMFVPNPRRILKAEVKISSKQSKQEGRN